MCRHRRWQENDEDGIDSGGVPVIDMAATGKNIYRLREAAGLSVKDLQARMELASLQAIYKWQHGDNIPSVDNLIILADILGVSMDDIIVWKRVRNSHDEEV